MSTTIEMCHICHAHGDRPLWPSVSDDEEKRTFVERPFFAGCYRQWWSVPVSRASGGKQARCSFSR